MLHAFDVTVDGVLVDVEEFEEGGKGAVPVDNGAGNALALVGEGSATVFDVLYEAFFVKLFEHVGDAGLRYFEFF